MPNVFTEYFATLDLSNVAETPDDPEIDFDPERIDCGGCTSSCDPGVSCIRAEIDLDDETD